MSVLDQLVTSAREAEQLAATRDQVERQIETLQKRAKTILTTAEQQADALLKTARQEAAALKREAAKADQDATRRLKDVATREAAVAWVDEQSQMLDRKERELAGERKALVTATAEARAAEQHWRTRQAEHTQKEADLDAREAAVRSDEQRLADKARLLKEREAALRKDEARLAEAEEPPKKR